MGKESKAITNNLMLKSIDTIYKYGGFTIDMGEFVAKIFVATNGVLNYERYDKSNAKVKITTINIKGFLAYLAYRTFFNIDNQIISIIPFNTTRSEKSRLKCANDMFDIYEYILVENPEMIKDIITSNNFLAFMDVAEKSETSPNPFDDIEILKRELVRICNDYSEDLMYGMELYNSLQNATSNALETLKKEWEEFKFQPYKPSRQKNETRKNVIPVPIDKLEIPHEIINDRNFLINPAIGREYEIREIGASLLSYSVNPVLLGEPGVGKTAIIEGLAYKIKNGSISKRLMDKKIIKVSPTAIVSGSIYRGSFEERMQNLIEYMLKHDDYILYIDEIHTAKGAGASSSSDNDILNILKPYIENGSIKIIGATTSEEYEEILLRDKAFTRRLRPITIKEPTLEALRNIVDESITKYEKHHCLSFAKDDNERQLIIDVLLTVTSEKNRVFKEKRSNPALVLSIIEQAFGYALYENAPYVGKDYIIEALALSESIYESSRNSAIYKLKNSDETKLEKPKIIEFKPIKESGN